MKISSQTYHKTYTFPFWSFSNLIKWIILAVIVVLPFFLSYSSPNFYLTSKYSINKNPKITYNNKYHITIVTDQNTFTYTNLFIKNQQNTISIKQLDDNNQMKFNIQWSKGDNVDRVLNVDVKLFFNYDYNGQSSFGIASANIAGYNIAQCSVSGILNIQSGTGYNTIKQNNLQLNSYDIAATQEQMIQSQSFLSYQYSALPINMQNDLLSVNLILNYAYINSQSTNASLLGQLIWSWVQYFPLFLSIYWICDKCLCFLLEQNIMKRKLVHDSQLVNIKNKIK